MRLFAWVLAVFLAFAPLSARAQQPDMQGMVGAAITGYLQPAYDNLEAQAEEARARVDALCGRPSGDTLKAARLAFAALVDAWSRVEFVRLGPAAQEHRAERFHFFPDERGIGLRQVQEILAGKDTTAADPVKLKDKSVAVQGLGALEFLLFGGGHEALVEKKDPFRCAYAHAVASNLRDIASALSSGWATGADAPQRLRAPGPDNPLYKSDGEALSDIVEILSTGLVIVRDMKLETVLGSETKKATPRRAVFRRSGLTIAAIRANLEGLRTLYRALAVSGSLGEADAWIDENVRFEFEHGLAALGEVTLPLEEALADETQRGKLAYVRIVARNLWQLVARDMTAALGLRTGFNALDGD